MEASSSQNIQATIVVPWVFFLYVFRENADLFIDFVHKCTATKENNDKWTNNNMK